MAARSDIIQTQYLRFLSLKFALTFPTSSIFFGICLILQFVYLSFWQNCHQKFYKKWYYFWVDRENSTTIDELIFSSFPLTIFNFTKTYHELGKVVNWAKIITEAPSGPGNVSESEIWYSFIEFQLHFVCSFDYLINLTLKWSLLL